MTVHDVPLKYRDGLPNIGIQRRRCPLKWLQALSPIANRRRPIMGRCRDRNSSWCGSGCGSIFSSVSLLVTCSTEPIDWFRTAPVRRQGFE